MVLAPAVKNNFVDGAAGTPNADVFATHMNTIGDLLNQIRTILVPWETKAVPTGAVVGTTDAQTLNAKTIALGVNTVSGTLAQFNTALTGDDFATLNGLETQTNKTLTSPTINTPTVNDPTVNNYTEGLVPIGNTGTAKTISLTNGTVQTATLTGNCTFTMPLHTAGKSRSFILELSTGAGGFTAVFTGVKWPNNTAPVVTSAGSKMDMFTFISNGVSWHGSCIQGYTP